MTKDHYSTLSVSPDAEDVVIRAAYLALMRRYHPDTHGLPPTSERARAATERARSIAAAFSVLGNPRKRAEYDLRRMFNVEPASTASKKTRGTIPFALFMASVVILLILLALVFIPSPSFNRSRSNAADQAHRRIDRKPYKKALQPSAALSCAPGPAQNLIKWRLIRRAIQIRGGDRLAFQRLLASAVFRIDLRAPAKDSVEQNTINCRALIRVLVPPDPIVGGVPRRLGGELDYSVFKTAAGNHYSVFMRNEDIIAGPLAGLQLMPRPVTVPVIMPVSTKAIASTPRPKLAESVIVRDPAQRVIAPARAGLPAQAKAASEPQVKATAKCGSATLGLQTGACSKENLAILNRMVTSFYRQSLTYADARKRAELLQTEGSFSRLRAMCRTDPCLRGVYLLRLREITDIMKSGPKLTR